MKAVASILALALALTPALAFAGPKDKAHHGKRVHAGQTHPVARAHPQPATPKTAKADPKKKDAVVVPSAHKGAAKAVAKPAVLKVDGKAATKPAKPDPKKADAPKAEPKVDAKDVIPAVAIAPAHDAKADAEKKKNRATRTHRVHKK
jgi:hypothetical protein